MKQCIDETTDAKMQQMVGQFGDTCSKPSNRREGEAYISIKQPSFCKFSFFRSWAPVEIFSSC